MQTDSQQQKGGAQFAPAIGSLLVWERRDDITERGYLRGHPETTLFLLQAIPFEDGVEDGVRLRGAFVPDDEENETWDHRNAQAAAEGYMLDWLKMASIEIAVNRLLDETHEIQKPKDGG